MNRLSLDGSDRLDGMIIIIFHQAYLYMAA